MLPAAEDNYGADACSLLCLAVSPAVLVIANQQGNIHHAVVLPRESDLDERGDEPLGKSHLADDLEVCALIIATYIMTWITTHVNFYHRFNGCSNLLKNVVQSILWNIPATTSRVFTKTVAAVMGEPGTY